MATRSTPRLAPGAHLGAHRPINLVRDEAPSERPAAAEAAPPSGNEKVDRALRLGRIGKPVWFSDMLVPERNSFGVLRLLMALAVLISHAVFLATGQNTAEPLYGWTGYTLGQHGVQVFFFLSGILVTQSLVKSESVRDYAIARGLRIFPALIVCVLLTAVVLGPWLSSMPAIAYLKDKAVAAYIIKTVSLMSGSAPLPGLFEGAPGAAKGAVNTSLWTLKYEVLCYVALAAIGWIAIRFKAYREVAAVAIAGWLALVLTQRVGIEIGSQKSAFEVFRYFALLFGAGAIAFTLNRWIPVHGLVLVLLGGVMAAAIGTRFAEPAMAVTLGYGALWLATFDFWGLRGYTNHSDYSYGTYIYGMPVSQALLHFVPGMSAVALALATAGIVLLLAFLSWELIERPALRLRHRLSAKADTRAVEAGEPVSRVGAQAPARGAVRAPSVAIFPKVADVFGTTTRATAETKAEAAATKPGDAPAAPVARPWRPVAAFSRLRVAGEEAAVDKATAKVDEQVLPEVPKDRIAMAIKRAAAGKMADKAIPIASLVKARIARKVVDVTAEDAAPKRQFRPRPAWRPMQPLGPEAL